MDSNQMVKSSPGGLQAVPALAALIDAGGGVGVSPLIAPAVGGLGPLQVAALLEQKP